MVLVDRAFRPMFRGKLAVSFREGIYRVVFSAGAFGRHDFLSLSCFQDGGIFHILCVFSSYHGLPSSTVFHDRLSVTKGFFGDTSTGSKF